LSWGVLAAAAHTAPAPVDLRRSVALTPTRRPRDDISDDINGYVRRSVALTPTRRPRDDISDDINGYVRRSVALTPTRRPRDDISDDTTGYVRRSIALTRMRRPRDDISDDITCFAELVNLPRFRGQYDYVAAEPIAKRNSNSMGLR